ncbi:MAG TPA: glutathione binding-like protein [Steroidobacteraceae bacterium]|jgi:glutathione S-transferase|nr:glutathione binding-like protein [Steroidobacteraceae bacterium]
MELYFAPLACSLATRIALYEAEAPARYTQADTRSKKLLDGGDFFAINPMGQVPALRLDDGTILTENTAILQYVADQFPQARLAPTSGRERSRLQQWLGFIGTELHKAIFIPLLDQKASEEVKAYARDKIGLRMGILQTHLRDREYVLDSFSIADAYLTTILNWATASKVDLQQWPEVHAYYQRMLKRPSIARAAGEEFALYKEEQKKKAV